MSDLQQIVADIHNFLAAADQTLTPELRELAAAYASACRETNERLRRCADLLHHGLRSEAIQLAEAEPNLLELVALLDMPQMGEWEEVCINYDLARPVRLALEPAAELNEAYTAEKPLESILYRHRVLALAQSPLTQRIEMLRLLAYYDAGSPIWEQDLAVFEQARFKQLRDEVPAAIKGNDRIAVKRLYEEATSDQWRTPVPEVLRHGLRGALAQYRRQDLLAQLRELGPRLDAAYTAMDFDECAALLKQWNALAAQSDGELPPDLREQGQLVNDWVQREAQRRQRRQNFADACAALRSALDGDAPSGELQSLRDAAAGFDEPVPDDLETRFQEMLAQRLRAARRRKARNIAIIAASVLVVAAGCGLLIHRNIQTRQREHWRDAILARLDTDQLDAADEVWASVVKDKPAFAAHPDLVSVKQRLDTMRQGERDRAADFRRYMDSALAGGVESPNVGALASAERAARKTSEKLEVMEFSNKLRAAVRDRQARRDADFETKAKAIGDELDRLAALPAGDLLAAEAPLREAERQVEQLRQGTTDISPAVAAHVMPFQGRIQDLRKTIREETALRVAAESERQLLANVKASAGSVASLTPALREYIQQQPDSRRAGAFKAALQHETQWAAIEEWRRLNLDRPPVNLEMAGKHAQAIDGYLKQHPNSPMTPAATAYAGWLGRASSAPAADGPWRGDLHKVLTSPLMRDVLCVRTIRGLYYTRAGERMNEDSLGKSFNAILSTDVGRLTRMRLKPAEVLGDIGPSPQAKLSTSLLEHMHSLTLQNGESFGLDALQTIIAASDVDCILRAVVALRIIELNIAACPAVSSTLRRWSQSLTELQCGDLLWMDPEDREATAARPAVTRALERIRTEIKDAKDLLAASNKSLVASALRSPAGAGVLLRESGKWIVATPVKPRAGLCLLAASSPSPASTTQPAAPPLLRVGAAVGDQWQLDLPANNNLTEGEMVFVYED